MKYFSLLICLILFSCSDTMDMSDEAPLESNQVDNSSSQKLENAIANEDSDEVIVEEEKPSDYYRKPIQKNVNLYAKWIAQDLFANIDFPSNQDVFVVSDFALLDSDLNETNHFGRQLSEALIHEVSRTGFSVIDIKATGFIRFSETGDVFFNSKDYTELSQKVPATNIIAGTLTKHQGGYLVNARVISMETMAVVSSAQAFVPYNVVEAVLLENPVKPLDVKPVEAVVEKEPEVPTGIPLKAYNKSMKK